MKMVNRSNKDKQHSSPPTTGSKTPFNYPWDHNQPEFFCKFEDFDIG